MDREALANFADADHAEVKHVIVRISKPLRDARIRSHTDQFGRDVGIQEEAAHRSIGRPVDLLRLKSRSSPRKGDSANRSTRLFRPSGRLYFGRTTSSGCAACSRRSATYAGTSIPRAAALRVSSASTSGLMSTVIVIDN